MMPSLTSLFWVDWLPGFAIALVLAGFIVMSQAWHGRFSHDSTTGVQRMHTRPTPRIGGLAIYLALLIMHLFDVDAQSYVQTAILLSIGFIVFSFGFVEDLTQKVSVAVRMWASLLPGLFAYFLSNQYLSNLDFAWLNSLLAVIPIGVFFTAFALSGMTHAMNFIDGLNGLAAWSALWILAGLGFLANLSGMSAELAVCMMFGGAITGFLLWNWPYGRLFLGDGGAYFIGLSLGWLAVSISVSSPLVSAWAMLLLCAYPITETLYSMARRARLRLSSGRPDRAHLHQLIASVLVYPRFSNYSPLMRNSISGLAASFMSVPACVAATQVYGNPWACIALFMVYVLLYHILYQALAKAMHAQQMALRSLDHQSLRQQGGGIKSIDGS